MFFYFRRSPHDMLEVELRSFISKEKHKELLEFFGKNSESLGEDSQVTYYFDGPHDLRIQQSDKHSKVWLKKGKLHDEAREEIEVKCAKDDFPLLEKLFLALGYSVSIKWFRNRHSFKWNGITVTIDDTKGYGCIIEMENLCEEAEKTAALNELKAAFAQLNLNITPKEEFERAFKNYKENWKSLV